MNKLFEKILTFIIFTTFFFISYLIFNINEVEHKIKEKRLTDGDILVEMDAPKWLIDYSACEQFFTYKKQKYGITKCINGDDISFFKDKDKDYSFENEYLYVFNKKNKKVLIIVNMEINSNEREKLIKDIKIDFSHLLGINYEEESKGSEFKLLNKNKKEDTPQFIMIKKEG